MFVRSFIGGGAATAASLMLGATPPALAASGENVLATLSDGTGSMPLAGLIADSAGNL